ncbi:type IV secretion system DNA-binding domain-containing protein, partial [Candidatus Parcubacteria bacterium]|nr:type IV secretion system DNA-binding domain-containing protein [Candidatus Parcubacteria bacterium]
MNDITYFGVTDARGKTVKFGIRKEDRLRHMYIIGKTGMGKSTLLENMAIQDIQNGEGMAYLDPHGTTAEKLLEFVPEHRIKDVIYFAPFDMEYPVALNVLEDTAAGDESSQSIRSQFIVSGLMSTFKKIWKDQWSARMEYILNYTLLALLEIPEATLLDVNRMLSDKTFRKDVIDRLKEPTVKAYWEKEFASMTDKMVAEAVPAIQNKVGQFISNALIRNIIGQTKSSFDFRKAMDEKKIIIFNLSIGRIGEDAVNLLGSLFVTKIYLAAMSRADISERDMKEMPNFYLYVDEFQNFIT